MPAQVCNTEAGVSVNCQVVKLKASKPVAKAASRHAEDIRAWAFPRCHNRVAAIAPMAIRRASAASARPHKGVTVDSFHHRAHRVASTPNTRLSWLSQARCQRKLKRRAAAA